MSDSVIRVLTVAGSDASGGAGMAADMHTFEEYGTYGQVALTTVVTMDKEKWNHHVHELPLDLVKSQFDTILASDVPIRAMKTGMLGTPEIVKLVSDVIQNNVFENVVIDPVLVCKGTDEVLNPDTADSIKHLLLPYATVATPNLFEAGVMSGLGHITTLEDMKEAARQIHDLGTEHIVIKGGKAMAGDEAIDLYYDGEEFTLLSEPKISSPNNHGAGCTFAAAITAGLGLGMNPREAVVTAKKYVTAAIRNGFTYNRFVGPVFRPGYRLEKQGRCF
ncbi:MAG TPA: bifunctional hydroxymethylpyrimidine kinase/phosphomethylpyrimidine kinase [Clostridiaceae bacterium]|nr:bifunctional hydroxymethylpyrimidine kinase/phosphomethylpyrimidine kinase [Clostridiaceae bacterium]